MASSKLDHTKKMIRSVLTSSKEGVSACNFDKDYYLLTQSRIKFQSFGFSTLHSFMQSIPDVVRISQKGGVVTYHAVACRETQHIQKMVANQSNKKKKRKIQSSKSIKPYQRFVNSAKRSVRENPGRNFWTAKPQKGQSSLPLLKSTSRIYGNTRSKFCRSQPLEKSSTRDFLGYKKMGTERKWTSSLITPKISSGFRICNVIKNRIRTLLGQNPSGVFSNHLVQLYLEAYDCELPVSVVYSIESGDLCDITKVEKLVSGNRERYIIFPKQDAGDNAVTNRRQDKSQSQLHNEIDVQDFALDYEKNTITLSHRMETCLKAVLREYPRGITSNDLKTAYFEHFDCKLPDSVLLAIECDQLKHVAKLEKRVVGNREMVTFFPYLSHSLQGSPVDQTESPTVCEDGMFQKTTDHKLKTRMKHILKAFPEGIALSRLKKIYYDAFKVVLDEEVIPFILAEDLTEVVEVKKDKYVGAIILPRKSDNQICSNPKYPGLSAISSERISCPKSLTLGAEYDVFITHISNCDHFNVQLTSYSKHLKNILKAAGKCSEYEDIFSLEQGTSVIDISALPKRGRVLAESGVHAYVDYGETTSVSKWNLSPLPQELKDIPELALSCALSKSNKCLPWSERASSKFNQLCLGKRATIKVDFISNELLNDRETEVYVVTCHLGSLDVNQRLMLENASSSIVGQELSSGIEHQNMLEVEEKNKSCGAQSFKKEKETEATSDSKLRKTEFEHAKEETQNDIKIVEWKGFVHGDLSNFRENPLDVVKSESSLEHPVERKGQTGIQGSNEVKSGGIVIPLLKTSGFQPLPPLKKEFYVISSLKQPFHMRDVGKFVTVKITRVISIGKFYMVPEERISILQRLTLSMNKFYCNQQKLGTELIGGRSLYAAQIEADGVQNWRRISLQDIVSNFASVFLVDIGEVKCIPTQSICKLHHEFAYLPPMAMIGRLAGIQPKVLPNSIRVTELFENLVLDRCLVAHLIKENVVRSNLVFDVCLCNITNDGYGQWINDMMVEDWRLADYISDLV